MAGHMWQAVSIFKIVILTAVVIASIVFMKRNDRRNPAFMTFFTLGTGCYLCTEIYYISNLLLKDSDRLPYFSAEDIGTYGGILLLTSCLHAAFPHKGSYNRRHIIFSAGFSLANAGLYVYYGTESISALIYAVVFGMFMAVILQCLEDMGALSRTGLYFFYAGSAVLCILLIAELFVNEQLTAVLGTAEAVFWFSAIVWLTICTVEALRKKQPEAVPFSFAVFLVCIFAMYMSYDPWYSIADILSALITFPILLSLSREVES